MNAKRLLYILVTVFPVVANSQDNALIQRLLREGRIVKAMQEWSIERGRLMCIYSMRADDSSGTSSGLSFYQRDSADYREVFHYEVDAHLKAILQDADSRGNLITIWLGASGFGLSVFSYVNYGVKVALEDGSRMLPEFAYVGDRNRFDIVVSQLDWVMDNKKGESVLVPDSATVYRWEGDRYRASKLPWKRRFQTQIENK